ncbi:hypothetical protein ACIP79_02910 [Streptomyces sp. NPDC088747]|uniref:hypothetical protein n=1 Tax=Streptomyces sp. NPDC088747 TaxID=3365886 RepID=UPI0038153B25
MEALHLHPALIKRTTPASSEIVRGSRLCGRQALRAVSISDIAYDVETVDYTIVGEIAKTDEPVGFDHDRSPAESTAASERHSEE